MENFIENVFCYGSNKIEVISYYEEKYYCVVCVICDFGLGILEDCLEFMFWLFF